MYKKSILIFLIFLSSTLSYCGKNSNDDSKSSRSLGLIANLFSSFQSGPLIKNISENVIYRSYVSLDTRVTSLQTLTSALPDSCGGNTSLLTVIQEEWKLAYMILKRIEIVQFGASGAYSTVDSWPLNHLLNPPDTTRIQATISGVETISETTLSSKSDNENGFPAIEYLLFDNGSGSSSTASICTVLSGRRKLYLQEAIKLLSTRVARIAFNWNPSNSGNFSTILQTAGSANEFYKSEKEVLDILIKQIVTLVEKIKDDKVGYPVGLSADSGGVVRSSFVEAKFTNLSTKAISENLSGIYNFYVGNDGPGLSDYVRYYNIALDERIRAKIKQAQAKAGEILDLRGDISSGNTVKVKELHTLCNELKIIFTVELAGNLGSNFTPGVGDGDGD